MIPERRYCSFVFCLRCSSNNGRLTECNRAYNAAKWWGFRQLVKWRFALALIYRLFGPPPHIHRASALFTGLAAIGQKLHRCNWVCWMLFTASASDQCTSYRVKYQPKYCQQRLRVKKNGASWILSLRNILEPCLQTTTATYSTCLESYALHMFSVINYWLFLYFLCLVFLWATTNAQNVDTFLLTLTPSQERKKGHGVEILLLCRTRRLHCLVRQGTAPSLQTGNWWTEKTERGHVVAVRQSRFCI